MSSSVRIIVPNICKNKKMFQTTNQISYFFAKDPFVLSSPFSNPLKIVFFSATFSNVTQVWRSKWCKSDAKIGGSPSSFHRMSRSKWSLPPKKNGFRSEKKTNDSPLNRVIHQFWRSNDPFRLPNLVITVTVRYWKWPSRNSGFSQLENGGSFHSYVNVYQRIHSH